MPSLASLVRKIIIGNRLSRKRPAIDSEQFLDDEFRHLEPKVVPLPTSISDRIPQELYERFIERLRYDRTSLGKCRLVCRAWNIASRYYMHSLLTVLPSVIATNGESMHLNYAVPLRRVPYLLYGSLDGVYILNYQMKAAPRLVFEASNVTQLEAFEEQNILVVLCERGVVTHPLNVLLAEQRHHITKCERITSNVKFFRAGILQQQTHLLLVKSSNVVKVMRLVQIPGGNYVLRFYKDFYVPAKIISLHFLKTKVVIGISNHGFEVMDIETLNVQSLLEPTVSFDTLKSAKCIAVYRAGDEFLLCYHTFAFYINKLGLVSRPDSLIHWRRPISALTLRYPYVLAISSLHLEVRHLETGALVQTVWLKHRLVGPSPELIVLQAADGRLIGLDFANQAV